MTDIQFLKLVNAELDALRYYTHVDSKRALNINSQIYDDLVSIGYTKRALPLDRRCNGVMLTADRNIWFLTKIEELRTTTEGLRDHSKNRYTALEIFWIKYPAWRDLVIENINADQKDVKPINVQIHLI